MSAAPLRIPLLCPKSIVPVCVRECVRPYACMRVQGCAWLDGSGACHHIGAPPSNETCIRVRHVSDGGACVQGTAAAAFVPTAIVSFDGATAPKLVPKIVICAPTTPDARLSMKAYVTTGESYLTNQQNTMDMHAQGS